MGLAIAKRFAHAGAHITIADLNVEGGTRAVKDLQEQGLSATFVRCDVTDHFSSMQAFEHALQSSPTHSIDVTALIAGVIGEAGSLVDKVLESQREKHHQPPQLRHSALDINLLGVYQCAYLALWYMTGDMHKPGGQAKDDKFSKSLIFVSSTVAYTDVGNFADYHASKCGFRPVLAPDCSSSPCHDSPWRRSLARRFAGTKKCATQTATHYKTQNFPHISAADV